jgi:hypothetical protein
MPMRDHDLQPRRGLPRPALSWPGSTFGGRYPFAVSRAGARGVAQLMPGTVVWFLAFVGEAERLRAVQLSLGEVAV